MRNSICFETPGAELKGLSLGTAPIFMIGEKKYICY
jgi:hypothetical protein